MRAACAMRSSSAPGPSSTRWAARTRRSRTTATTATMSAASATAQPMSATIPAVELSTTPTLLGEQDRVRLRVVVGLLLARDRLDGDGHRGRGALGGYRRQLQGHHGVAPGL